jgi:hypothetical protein
MGLMLLESLPEVGDDAMALMLLATLPLAVLGTLMLVTARMSTHPNVNIYCSPGVRTSATLQSREAWLAAHRAVKRPTLIGGYVLSVMSLFNAFLGALWDIRYAIVLELAVLIPLPLFGLWIAWVAHKVARHRYEEPR